jgi:hypothetical protein
MRRTRRRKDVSGGDGDVTPGNEDMAMVKSEPLVGVLEMIKRHEKFPLFERRLEKNQVLHFFISFIFAWTKSVFQNFSNV